MWSFSTRLSTACERYAMRMNASCLAERWRNAGSPSTSGPDQACTRFARMCRMGRFQMFRPNSGGFQAHGGRSEA